MEDRACGLCHGEAALYCSADSAFLCFNCDSFVHSANFLVARHVRCIVCSCCESITDNSFAGVESPPILPICHACYHRTPKLSPDSDSSSSSCLSSAESTVTRRKIVRSNCSKPELFSGKVEAILMNWCRKLGLVTNSAMRVAMEVIGLCSSESTFLPFRVLLSASLWFGLRPNGDGSMLKSQGLKRLEEVSGVPAKLILDAGSKISRLLNRRRTAGDQHEEGWDEC